MTYQPTIKPIETVYNGYRFRSRLEARWAVFFDVAGIKYEYEPEGFDTGITWYLPDFYLSRWRTRVEIKPSGQIPAQKDLVKIKSFASTKAPEEWYLVIAGEPYGDNKSKPSMEIMKFNFSYGSVLFREQSNLLCGPFSECPSCHEVFPLKGSISIGDVDPIVITSCCTESKHYIRRGHQDRVIFLDTLQSLWFSPKLVKAYTTARQARFEQRVF